MTSIRGSQQTAWNGPADMNETIMDTEAITILHYWDVTSPPSKAMKQSKLFHSVTFQRINLEMHGPKESDSGEQPRRSKFFLRITTHTRDKSDNSITSLDDDASVTSNVSTGVKSIQPKPDYEWTTKLLLDVSKVVITNIKNEKHLQLFFELREDGEIHEQSFTFQDKKQAKEFSNHLERFSNLQKGQSQEREQEQEQDVETGLNQTDQDEQDHNEGTCVQRKFHNLIFQVANVFHLIGFAIFLLLLFYAIAICSIETDPAIQVAIVIFIYSIFVALTHSTGSLGIHEKCCGILFIDLSCILAVLNVLFNCVLVALFATRKDEFFTYIKNHHDKLFLPENDIDNWIAHPEWVYCLIILGCLSEIAR